MFQAQAARAKSGFWLLSQDKIARFFFYLLVLFLPTQLGKHFWPQFSFVDGIRLDYLSPTIYFTDALILLIIFFSFKKIIKFILSKPTKDIFLYLLFFLSLLIGLGVAKNPGATVYGILKLIEYLFLGIFITTSFKNINKKILAYLLICGILFESLLAIAQVINSGSLNGIFYFLGERYFTSQTPGIANASISGQLFLRPYATFSHPNVLAGYLIIATLFIYKYRKYVVKKHLYLIIAIVSISLLITLSRIAILFWLMLLILKFGSHLLEKYKKRNLNKQNTTKIFLFIVLIFPLSLFLQNSIFLQRFFQTSLSEDSFVQRKELINQSIIMFSQNPVFGVGINNFYNNVEPISEKSVFIQPVHNIFLLILSQTGIIGLSAFLLLILKSIKKIFLKVENHTSALLILTLVVIGMFDHYFLTIQQGQLLLVLIFSERFSAKIN